jgi:hypothetical protein
LTGKPLALWPEESLVEGDFAAVKCTGPAELEGKYLVLFFAKTDQGWRNCSLRNSPPSTPLRTHLANGLAEMQKLTAAPAGPEGDWIKLLNEDQRAVLAWTDRQFRSYFDARTFAGWSDAEKAALETRCIDALKGPRSRDYYQAINTLGALRATNGLPALRAIAYERADKDNRDRWMAIRSLGLIADKADVPELIHLVYHGNINTRWWAQLALVQITKQNFGKDWNAWAKWWSDQRGEPAYKPEIIRWWGGQAEPEQLAQTLDESDVKFLADVKGKSEPASSSRNETGEHYIAEQTKQAEAGNYWAKFKLWEAYAKGTHGIEKNVGEADKRLPDLIKGAYLAKFEPQNGFNPKTPGEMLSRFNQHCPLYSAPNRLGGASFFRTTNQNGKLIGSFLTELPDEFKQSIANHPDLKLISIEPVTPEMFKAHEASRQESL